LVVDEIVQLIEHYVDDFSRFGVSYLYLVALLSGSGHNNPLCLLDLHARDRSYEDTQATESGIVKGIEVGASNGSWQANGQRDVKGVDKKRPRQETAAFMQ
jgi:hypothetical protein